MSSIAYLPCAPRPAALGHALAHSLPQSFLSIHFLRNTTLPGQLHAARVAAGALELASAELRFRTEPDTGAPCGVVCKQKVGSMDWCGQALWGATSSPAGAARHSAHLATPCFRPHVRRVWGSLGAFAFLYIRIAGHFVSAYAVHYRTAH